MTTPDAWRYAQARASKLPALGCFAYMTAYHEALRAHQDGRDLDDVWQAAHLARASTAYMAGLVEGMAATRTEAT